MAQVSGDANQKYTPVKVDLLGPQATELPSGQVSIIDPKEDAWEQAPPVPKGLYRLKLFLSDRGCVVDYRDRSNRTPAGVYYSINLECRVVDHQNPEYNGRVIFANVRTMVPSGKRNSTCAGLLGKMGGKIPDGWKVDDKAQATYLLGVLKKEPVLPAYVDWQGGFSPSPTLADPNPRWKNLCRSMDDFPVINGVRQHIYMYKYPGGQEEIIARPQVIQWYGKDETPKVPTQAVAQTIEDAAAPSFDLGTVEDSTQQVNAGDELAFQ